MADSFGSGDRAADDFPRESERVRRGWRPRSTLLVAIAVLVAFLAGVLVGEAGRDSGERNTALRSGDEPGEREPSQTESTRGPAEEAQASTTTLGATPPPPTSGKAATTQLATEPAMREVLRDARGQWSLWRSTTSSCLELRVNSVRHGGLLCSPARVSGPVGEGHTVATDIGHLFVGLTDGTPDGAITIPPDSSAVGADQLDKGLGYAVARLTAGSPTPVILTESDAPVVHITVPAVPGPVSLDRLLPRTESPYGRLARYTRGALTGFWYGGHEIVGFYDGPSGRRCVRWGRYGGMDERLLADSCAAGAAASRGIVFARVVRDSSQRPGYRVIAVVAAPATKIKCSGSACPFDPRGVGEPDRSGSGLVVAAAPFAGTLSMSPGDVITVTAWDANGAEVDRRDISAGE